MLKAEEIVGNLSLMSYLIVNKEYVQFLQNIKQYIQLAQQRAHFGINQELIFLY